MSAGERPEDMGRVQHQNRIEQKVGFLLITGIPLKVGETV